MKSREVQSVRLAWENSNVATRRREPTSSSPDGGVGPGFDDREGFRTGDEPATSAQLRDPLGGPPPVVAGRDGLGRRRPAAPGLRTARRPPGVAAPLAHPDRAPPRAGPLPRPLGALPQRLHPPGPAANPGRRPDRFPGPLPVARPAGSPVLRRLHPARLP